MRAIHIKLSPLRRFGLPSVRGLCSSSALHHSDLPKDATTHFGFQTVPFAEKQGKVNAVFHEVADKYDLMNDVMSGTVHRLWKDYFVDQIGTVLSKDKPVKVLDVAGGTGDIAFRLARGIRSSLVVPPSPPEIVVTDINESMLKVGQERAEKMGFGSGSPVMSWVVGDAQCLPMESNTFDLYTIAFGIRNVPDVQQALNEAYRVLKPGGRLMVLEFSHVVVPGIKELYDMYSFNVVPTMGQLVAQNREAYQYLVESIRKFPNQDEFAAMIKRAGFSVVSYQNLTFGVVAIHSGFKLAK